MIGRLFELIESCVRCGESSFFDGWDQYKYRIFFGGVKNILACVNLTGVAQRCGGTLWD